MKNLKYFLLGAGLFICAGLAQASGVYPIIFGGTGTSTAPTYGKMLIGDSNGNYEFVASSTLGQLGTTYTATYPITLTGSAFGIVATSSFGLLVNSFASPNISQWTNDSNYFATTSTNYWLTQQTTDSLTQGSTNKYWSNILFDNRLSATTSLPNIITLGSLSLPYGQLTGTPAYLFPSNSTSTPLTFTGLFTTTNASSTLFSSAYASSTQGYFGTAYLPSLGTAAGTFLAADPNGKVIATSTPSSTSYWTLSGNNIYNNNNSGAGYVGIGTTTPPSVLTVQGATVSTPTVNLYMWGGGGGGAKSADPAGGGGAGSYVKVMGVSVVGGISYTVKVAAGGGGSATSAGGTGYQSGGNGVSNEGGGGGSSSFNATYIACGGGGGSGGSSSVNGKGATGTSGGAGGSDGGASGGGGGCGTAGTAGSGGGAGGTGGTTTSGTNGDGGGGSSGSGGGGSSAGTSGNGNSGGANTGGNGSGGAAGGTQNNPGTAGSGTDSGGGGGGGGTNAGGGSGKAGGAPGAGGGAGNTNDITASGAGAAGQVIVVLNQNGTTATTTYSTPGTYTFTVPYISTSVFDVWTNNGGSLGMRVDNFGHLITGGTAPTANSCTGFSVSGNDRTGTITYTAATSCSVNFANPYAVAPVCSITPEDVVSTAAASTTTTGFTAYFGTAQNKFGYICQQ